MEMNPENASGNQPNVDSVNSEGKDKVAYETHRKLLGEKKKLQADFQALQDQLNSIELEKKQAEGNKDEVITSLRSQLEESKSQVKEVKKNFAWNTIQAQIKSEAVNRGCVNPDALIRLMSRDELNTIEIDDGFNINKDDLSRVLDGAKERFKDIQLFKAPKTKVHDVGSNIADFTPPKKSLEEMTPEEIKQALRNME